MGNSKKWLQAASAAFEGKWRWLSLAFVGTPAAYAALSQKLSILPAVSPWLGVVLSMAMVSMVFLMRLARLEARLVPKLVFSGTSVAQAEMRPEHTHLRSVPIAAEYVHVHVEAKGEINIPNCSLNLLRIRKTRFDGIRDQRQFSPPIKLITAIDHKTLATCYHGVPLVFDLAASLSSDNVLQLAPRTPGTPNTLKPEFFGDVGVYEFDLRATSDVPPSVGATVTVQWTGKWDGMKPSIAELS